MYYTPNDYGPGSGLAAVSFIIVLVMYAFFNWIVFAPIAGFLAARFKRAVFPWVFFSGFFPFIILWLLAMGKREGVGAFKKCSKCSELIEPDAKLCPYCRTDQYPDDVNVKKTMGLVNQICPSCHAVNSSDAKECFACGKEL